MAEQQQPRHQFAPQGKPAPVGGGGLSNQQRVKDELAALRSQLEEHQKQVEAVLAEKVDANPWGTIRKMRKLLGIIR